MKGFTLNIKNIIIIITVMFFFSAPVNAQQNDSVSFWKAADSYKPLRGRILALGMTAAYAGSVSLLYTAWYKDYPQSSFHFFNDGSEWLQMDKLGHVGSSYYLGRWCSELTRWTGASQRKSALIGTGTGFIFQLSIEVMDAYSSEWGFSTGDIIANTTGSGLFLSQELLWGTQRISYKYSYHESGISFYRPDALGSTLPERMLKDYNGQTYWLSANIKSFLSEKSKFPAWLNIAVGYGADGMIGAEYNETSYNGRAVPKLHRLRQFYLAPDIDLSKIKTKSGFLKTVFQAFGFVKFPAPAIEYRSDGRFFMRGFYF